MTHTLHLILAFLTRRPHAPRDLGTLVRHADGTWHHG